MITNVFFDLDDTLYDTTRLANLARRAAVHSMINRGLPMVHEDALARLKEIIREKGSNFSNHFDILVEESTGEKNNKLVSAGIIGYHNSKFANIMPFDDTMSTLIDLRRRGLTLNVISNGRAVKQWEKIIRLGLEAFFKNVIISEEVGFSKPDGKIYEIAMDEAKCAPEESLFVDNDIVSILGARKMGINTILMNRVSKLPESTHGGPAVNSLSEILPLLGKI